MARRLAIYISLFLLLEYSGLHLAFTALSLTYSPILAAPSVAGLSVLVIFVLWKSWSAGALLRGAIGVGFGVCALSVASIYIRSSGNVLLFESAVDAQQRVTMLTLGHQKLTFANGHPCPQCKSHIFVVYWSYETPTWFACSACGAVSLALLLPPLIQPWLRRRQPLNCEKCGYNLTGNISGVCPECGRQTARADSCKQPT